MKRTISTSFGAQITYTYDLTAPDGVNMRHCHDYYEILFVVRGSGRLVIEGSTFNIRPGSLVIIKPFEYHGMELDADAPYERYVISFPISALVEDAKKPLLEILNSEDTNGRFYSAQALSENVVSLFDRLDVLSGAQGDRDVYYKMLLSELIVLLSICDGERITHSEEELGARVIKYLNEYITKDISLDKLARRFFVSKYYLCRAFKKHNGISIHGYINQKRVMYAKQLIESGESASGAAYRVGFGDYSAFYRAYVKVLGKSPTAD